MNFILSSSKMTKMLTSLYTSTTEFDTNELKLSPLLTRHEYEILHLIAHEYSSKEIAKKLFMSCQTINSHRKNLMNEISVRNTAGMVHTAFELQLLTTA